MSMALESEAVARFPLRLAGGGRDEKSWAKRFVYRFERGDMALSTVQIHFAHMALELPMPTGSTEKAQP